VVVVNESFSSTTVADALFIGARVLEKLLEIGALVVYVTFIDELSRLPEATVSMVAEVLPEGPSVRTFKLSRRPADGRAYAMALARKHGLSYNELKQRVAR
jgi:DNA mismatch repair protein MutS